MEQSSPGPELRLRNLLSSVPGITALHIDGFIKAYLHIRAYGELHNPQQVHAFDAAVLVQVSATGHATWFEDLTTSLHTGFMLIVVRITAPGLKQEYNHCGLWSDEVGTKSRVRTYLGSLCA